MPRRRYIRSKYKVTDIRGIDAKEAERLRNELQLRPTSVLAQQTVVEGTSAYTSLLARVEALEAGVGGEYLELEAQSAAPDNPAEGFARLWLDDYGDIWASSTYLGTTQTTKIFNFEGSAELSPSPAILELTGGTPVVVSGIGLSPAAASITITGQTPTIFQDELLESSRALIRLFGTTPIAILTGVVLNPTAASITLTGQTPTIPLLPLPASITVSGQTSVLRLDQLLPVTAASVTVSGQQPTVVGGEALTPVAASITITGQTPAIQPILAPTPASVTLTGQTPLVAVDTLVAPTAASLTVTGQTPTIDLFLGLEPTAASLTITGQTPTVTTFDISNVFSTDLWTGDATSETVTNGVDLSTEGGMVWIKNRAAADNHTLFDTERGATKYLSSNGTGAETTDANSLTAFNTTGYTLGSSIAVNENTETYVGWTFRKAAGFFDVVTYTGNGANRTISHSLGVEPGCIIVKNRDATTNWPVYHRSNTGAPETDYLVLDGTAATADYNLIWNDTAPTSSVFSIGTDSYVNTNSENYVAYLFAHDASSTGLIQCGVYTGNGSTSGPTISLGWDPQWVLIKRTDSSSGWSIFDSGRGGLGAGNDPHLGASTSSAEDTDVSASDYIDNTGTGFQIVSASTFINASAGTFIYVAIREE